MTENRKQGPNVKKLITTIMARMAIPPKGGLSDGIPFFTNTDRIIQAVEDATKEAFEHIDALKQCSDWDKDDEQTAKAILDKISEQRRK